MDDLEFRRRCIANPFDQDEAFRRKIVEFGEYANLYARQVQFDRRLRTVLLNVEVPEDLQARIQLRHTLQRQAITWKFWRRSLALAASLIITVSVVALLISPREDLKEAVLTHLHNELYHLAENNRVDDAQIKALLSSAGGRLEGEIGTVSYAGSCQIRHRKGVHLVLQGQVGPVTVLLMPGEYVTGREAVEDARFKGIMLPTPKGSMAILGGAGEPLLEHERRILSSIEWKHDI